MDESDKIRQVIEKYDSYFKNMSGMLTNNSGEGTAVSIYVNRVNNILEPLDGAKSFLFLSCNIGTDIATVVIDREG